VAVRPAAGAWGAPGARLQHRYQKDWTPAPGQKVYRTDARFGRNDNLPMPKIAPAKTLRTMPEILS